MITYKTNSPRQPLLSVSPITFNSVKKEGSNKVFSSFHKNRTKSNLSHQNSDARGLGEGIKKKITN